MPNFDLLGVFGAIDPYALLRLFLLVLAIHALGHWAQIFFGMRYGLPLTGLAAGFVSSTATIYAMGKLAAQDARLMRGAAAGAVLSTVSTMLQLGVVVGSMQTELLHELIEPLALGVFAAVAYAALVLYKHPPVHDANAPGHSSTWVDLPAAVGFVALVCGITWVSAAMNLWLGEDGMRIGAALTGLVDPHATAAAMATLVNAGKVQPLDAQLPILVGLTANTVVKMWVAWHAAKWAYLLRLLPGLLAVLLAVWLGVAIG